ncbi:hypothetical protein ACFEMC_21785 [Kineococcus sp. DHX-1]|uniref:hypothetical protein n=1 Tax=Kineococcus sp. DHX-1 TaxID=3349638 RepID=UPI0036D41281
MGSVAVVFIALVVSALVLVALIVTLLVRDRGRDRSSRDVPHRSDWDLAGSAPMAHRRGTGTPSGS